MGDPLDLIWRGVEARLHSKSGSSVADINPAHDLEVSGVRTWPSQTCPEGSWMEGDSKARSAGESAV